MKFRNNNFNLSDDLNSKNVDFSDDSKTPMEEKY